MQVNRYLKDKAMDHIDHALGRPVDPLTGGHRNHYAADKGGEGAAAMEASPHWREVSGMAEDLRFFVVTDAGRKALSTHLQQIGDKHRLYSIEWDGLEMTQVGTSHGNARYLKWLSVSDCRDISFKDFAKTARVRLA